MGFLALPANWPGGQITAPGRGLANGTEPGEGGTMDEISIPVSSASDIVTARLAGRDVAERAGFKSTDLTVVSTVISEMARNILDSSLPGEIAISICQESGKAGIVVIARTSLTKKFHELFFANGLRRSMDECKVDYRPGETILTMKKWVDVWAQ